jgi:hypothetical protein
VVEEEQEEEKEEGGELRSRSRKEEEATDLDPSPRPTSPEPATIASSPVSWRTQRKRMEGGSANKNGGNDMDASLASVLENSSESGTEEQQQAQQL